jgi:hypothetical protein
MELEESERITSLLSAGATNNPLQQGIVFIDLDSPTARLAS